MILAGYNVNEIDSFLSENRVSSPGKVLIRPQCSEFSSGLPSWAKARGSQTWLGDPANTEEEFFCCCFVCSFVFNISQKISGSQMLEAFLDLAPGPYRSSHTRQD